MSYFEKFMNKAARQFLELMDKPDVEYIEGLSPSIAIEQRTASRNPRSTVATSTEIYDYLRVLFARVGTPYCYQCGRAISALSVPQMADQVMGLPPGRRITILAPVVVNRKGEHTKLLERLRAEGYSRIRLNGEVLELEELPAIDKNKRNTIEAVVDRLVIKPDLGARLTDSLELALKLADGVVRVAVVDGEELIFSERFACDHCGVSLPELSPRLFSFNSPQGACPACSGLGTRLIIDPDLVVPNPALSLREGAIRPWAHRHSLRHQQMLEALEQHYHFSIHTPFKALPREVQEALLFGSKGSPVNFFYEEGGRRFFSPRPFPGVVPLLKERYARDGLGPGAGGHRAVHEPEALPGLRRGPAAPGGPGGQDRRGQHQRGDRLHGDQGLDLVRGPGTFSPPGGDRPADLEGNRRPAGLFRSQRGARLPVAEPQGPRHPLRRRVPAHPSRLPGGFRADRRALHPGRTIHRPAPARQHQTTPYTVPPAGHRQHPHRGRTRPRNHGGGGLDRGFRPPRCRAPGG